MKRFREFWENAKKEGACGGFITLATSVFLLIASFFAPPFGEINKTVLQAVAELFAFATLWRLPNIIAAINDGHSLKFSAGGVDVTVASDKEEEEEN